MGEGQAYPVWLSEGLYIYYSPRLDAFLRVCGAPDPGRRHRCLRPWGHDGEHESQTGDSWAPETTETTAKEGR